MSMFADAEMTKLRERAELLLSDTAYIYLRSMSSDGQGGKRESWSDAVSAACRVAQMSREQAEKYADKLGSSSGWIITLPYDTEVKVYDKIVVGDAEYRVVGTNENESWSTVRRAYCARAK